MSSLQYIKSTSGICFTGSVFTGSIGFVVTVLGSLTQKFSIDGERACNKERIRRLVAGGNMPKTCPYAQYLFLPGIGLIFGSYALLLFLWTILVCKGGNSGANICAVLVQITLGLFFITASGFLLGYFFMIRMADFPCGKSEDGTGFIINTLIQGSCNNQLHARNGPETSKAAEFYCKCIPEEVFQLTLLWSSIGLSFLTGMGTLWAGIAANTIGRTIHAFDIIPDPHPSFHARQIIVYGHRGDPFLHQMNALNH